MARRSVVRGVAGGLAAVAAYLLVAGSSFLGGLVPAAPLLDGLGPPPPYRWVTPPADRVRDNQQPAGRTQSVDLTSGGSAGSVTTPDGQLQVITDPDSIALAAGQKSVDITMTPIDATTVSAAPTGHYDSNAYKVSAAYQPSGQPVVTLTATVVITYATNSSQVIEWNGSSWQDLSTTPAGNNQLFAPITSFGIFATVAQGAAESAAKTNSNTSAVIGIIVGFVVILAVVVAVFGPRILGRR